MTKVMTELEMIGASQDELKRYIWELEKLHKATDDVWERCGIAKSQMQAVKELHERRD